jgi:GMP synthase-like glutamine amidotransferase
MNIHVLQHVPFEGPGSIGDWCIANGHTMTTTLLCSPDAVLPETGTVDVLVIMGGPMNVYEEATHPFLLEEKDFIRGFLRTGRPALGICLGAQLLAVCAGARVVRAPNPEIGWFEVRPTPAARQHPWLCSLLAAGPLLFHWHGDRFEIPPGAENLAITEANDNQAFVLGKGRIAGLQFHPEITPALLSQMVAEGRNELIAGAFIQSPETILSKADFREPGIFMRGIMDWLTA